MIGRKLLCVIKHRFATRTRGQALVEFALSATLLFFLLCASIDLGLIFFAVQGLHNAAQEGATYGSRWLITVGGKRVLNADLIRQKVRTESGDTGGTGFVNLLDLNGDGIDDSAQPDVLNTHIKVQMLSDSPGFDGNPLNNGVAPDYTPCDDAAIAGPGGCYAYVTVQEDHKLIFPLTPAFADMITLHSSSVIPIRDSFNQGDPNATPVITTPEPTTDPENIVVELATGIPTNANQSQTNYGFKIYDKGLGTDNGTGIKSIHFEVKYPSGATSSRDDYSPPFCAFSSGTSCSTMPGPEWNSLPGNGATSTVVITITVTNSNGQTSTSTQTVTVTKP